MKNKFANVRLFTNGLLTAHQFDSLVAAFEGHTKQLALSSLQFHLGFTSFGSDQHDYFSLSNEDITTIQQKHFLYKLTLQCELTREFCELITQILSKGTLEETIALVNANLHQINLGWPALYYAMENPDLRVPDYLLKTIYQNNGNIIGLNDMSMLYRAALNGNFLMIQLLIKYGADPTLKDHIGDDIYGVLRRRGHYELSALTQAFVEEIKNKQPEKKPEIICNEPPVNLRKRHTYTYIDGQQEKYSSLYHMRFFPKNLGKTSDSVDNNTSHYEENMHLYL